MKIITIKTKIVGIFFILHLLFTSSFCWEMCSLIMKCIMPVSVYIYMCVYIYTHIYVYTHNSGQNDYNFSDFF